MQLRISYWGIALAAVCAGCAHDTAPSPSSQLSVKSVGSSTKQAVTQPVANVVTTPVADRARVTDAFGVAQRSQGDSPNFTDINVGDVLSPATTVKTGPGSAVLLLLADGHVFRVGADTTLKLTELGTQKNYSFALASGQVWSLVQHASHPTRYEVDTPSAVVGVSGTLFSVAYNAKSTDTLVSTDDGVVTVRQGRQTTRVSRGFETRVHRNQTSQFVPRPRSSAESHQWQVLHQQEGWLRRDRGEVFRLRPHAAFGANHFATLPQAIRPLAPLAALPLGAGLNRIHRPGTIGFSTRPVQPGKPPFGKTGFGKPSFGKPSYGKPGFGKPGFGKAGFGKPGFGKPGFGKPGFGKPSFGKPSFGKPGFGKPGFGKPGFGKPGFGKAGFRKAGFGKPRFGMPGFGKPIIQKPRFGRPRAIRGGRTADFGAKPHSQLPRAEQHFRQLRGRQPKPMRREPAAFFRRPERSAPRRGVPRLAPRELRPVRGRHERDLGGLADLLGDRPRHPGGGKGRRKDDASAEASARRPAREKGNSGPGRFRQDRDPADSIRPPREEKHGGRRGRDD